MLNGPHAEAFRPNSPSDNPWFVVNDELAASDEVAVLDPLLGPHEVEQNVWRELQQVSGGHFSSLIVRRMEDGVCLQGVLETRSVDFLGNVDNLVKRVACVNHVLNQLVVRESLSS